MPHRRENREPKSCCYCGRDSGFAPFEGREHVIPQAFGTFTPESILAYDVCDDCNHYFGNKLDVVLARSALEGVMRFQFGGKPASEWKPTNASLVRAKAESGRWKGMLVRQSVLPATGVLGVVPIRQIGFSGTADGPYEYFPLDQLPTREQLAERYGNEAFASGQNLEPGELERALAALGVRPEGEVTLDHSVMTDGERVFVESIATVDLVVMRAIAKIAFNYLIARAPDVARAPFFDEIRRFIRDGVKPEGPHRVMIREAPLFADQRQGTRLHGHAITIHYDAEAHAIVANVMFFGATHYMVVLAHGITLSGAPFEFGHFFNLATRRIEEVRKS